MTLEELKTKNKSLYENLRDEAEREFDKRGAQLWANKIALAKESTATDLKSVFAENLKAAIEAAKAEVAQQEREKLMNDPSVAGAKSALEALKSVLRPFVVPEDVQSVIAAKDKEMAAIHTKLAEMELEVINLKKENDELTAVAKEAGYKFHLESMLHGVPQADLIRNMVGDVKLYENVQDLDRKVSDVVDEMLKEETKKSARDQEIAALKEENEKLKLAAEKALEASKYMAVMGYVEERLRFHPKKELLREVMETRQPTTKEEIDAILTKYGREKKSDSRTIEEARSRVREMLNSGTREYISESEEPKKEAKGSSLNESYNNLGQSVDTLRALSGIETDDRN